MEEINWRAIAEEVEKTQGYCSYLNDFPTVKRTKLVSVSFDTDEVKIIPFGDWHLGSRGCDEEKIDQTIDYIKKSGSYVIGMGDFAELISKNSVGSVSDQIYPPDIQVDMVEAKLSPIKKQIIGLHDGNHEDRVWKDPGLAVIPSLCRVLGVPYLGWSCFIRLKVRNFNYIIYSTHGSSNATKGSTKMKACQDLASFAFADVYLYAHTHGLGVAPDPYLTIDLKNRRVVEKKRFFCLTGGYHRWWGSYAEKKLMKPTKTGCLKIKLFGDRWDIHCSA